MSRATIFATRNATAGPSRLCSFPSPPQRCLQRLPRIERDTVDGRRGIITSLFPQPPLDHRRSASTSTSQTDWLSWLRKAASSRSANPEVSRKALLFAGLVRLNRGQGCEQHKLEGERLATMTQSWHLPDERQISGRVAI